MFKCNNRMIVVRHALQQLYTLCNQWQILPSCTLPPTQLVEKGMCRVVMSQLFMYSKLLGRTNEDSGQIHRAYRLLSRHFSEMVTQGESTSRHRF